MKKLLVIALVLLGFSATSFAQLSAWASMTAIIQSPTSMSKGLDMNFGTIYRNVSLTSQGTVKIAPQQGLNSVATGVVLSGGLGQAAKFTITGDPLSVHIMTFPNNTITLVDLASGSTMNLILDFSNLAVTTGGSYTAIASGPGNVSVTLPASGSLTFYVGATLYIEPNQTPGTYTNVNVGDCTFMVNN